MNQPLRLTLLLALLPSLWLSSCKAPPPAAPPAPESSGPAVVELTEEGMRNALIQTARVDAERFAPRLSVVATLQPDPAKVARLGPRVTGRVVQIDVRLGDVVSKGQPLVQLEAVEVHKVASEFLTALARSKEAADALQRQKQLNEERVGSVAELRRAEADAEAATAQFREAQEHLEFLGLSPKTISAIRGGNLKAAERSVVRSPIAGRVASLSATLGQVLNGTEELVTVVDSEELWAELRIYERDVAGVQRGAPVEVKVPSYPDETFTGTIEGLAEAVDPKTRTVLALARLENPGARLKMGMSASARIQLRADPSTLWLPAEAVQRHGLERIVFLKLDERRFQLRSVSAGSERYGFVPVTGGLEPGAEVVVQGAFALRGELTRAETEAE